VSNPYDQALDAYEERAKRPKIRLGVDLDRVVDEAILALSADPNVYQRGGYLVHVVRDLAANGGAPLIRRMAVATLRERLAAAAEWETYDGRTKGFKPSTPPDIVVLAVAARGEWRGIRPLVGILEAPALRPDGSVIQARGYDQTTGFLLEPNADYPEVAAEPTRDDALAALAELDEVFADFPFAYDAARSAALAMLLTIIARPAIAGPCPMGAVDATTRGTGKGRLVDAIANIATGRDAAKTPIPDANEEMGKLITSLVAEGEMVACLDNIAHAIALPSLDNALTATVWKQRELAKNSTIYAPHRIVWFATGNNLEFGGDLARRVIVIRLESPLESPEERTDFRHPDLLSWVRENRPRLVRAALTMLCAHARAGRPKAGARTLGSFEAWSAIVPAALTWLDRADPLGSRPEADAASDRTKVALVGLLEGWARLDPHAQGMTVSQVIRLLYPERRGTPAPPDPPGVEELREALESLVPSQGGKPPNPAKVGNALRRYRKRVIGGRMFDCKPARAGSVAWIVTGGTGGTGGADSLPALGNEEVISKKKRENGPTSPTSPTIGSQLDLAPASEPDEDELEERRAIQAEACGEAAQ